jgi:hypothetical protein
MRRAISIGLALIAFACGSETRQPQPAPEPPPPPTPEFATSVRPVLEKRCAVCHGCYDSPCQLDLTAYPGVTRGATKQPVYDSARLRQAPLTRLFEDAHSTAAWREKGFVSVLGRSPDEALLLRMLALGQSHPFPPDQALPDDFPLDISRSLTCPTADEFDAYAAKHPQGGMPYGMAGLPAGEVDAIAKWAHAGAPPSPARAVPASLDVSVVEWETFLNGDSLKEQVVARYLYEHWFLAHLYFPDAPSGPFFRVVRSRTAPGQPVDEIATRRPYDDPGVPRVYYRIVPRDAALLHKTHIVYELGPARMTRLRGLFLAGDWSAAKLPSYERDVASNPFESFAEIPSGARYRFLLDDARYFVMNFIRGPVCYGQVAVDVIEDRFFVAFLAPDRDLSVTDPAFLARAAPLLALPAETGSEFIPGKLWLDFNVKQLRYLDLRAGEYKKLAPKGATLDWIWDGDQKNRNSQLTVFRHFDSAAVVYGFVGPWPKTAWIMDYPIFERIYYDLVAGFDVYGNVTHQVSTRLYMDHLRMQSEDTFLAFLPEATREPLRASWYVGATHPREYFLVDKIRSQGVPTQIRYKSDQPMDELLERIVVRGGAASGPPDLLNRCAAPNCARPGASADERAAEHALRRLSGRRGPWVATLPELSLVHLRGSKGVYSIAHDVAHTNVAFMFDEDERLEPAEDTVAVARGVAGSYPNFVFDVPPHEMEAFVSALLSIRIPGDLYDVADRWGVRRTSPRFWATIDVIQAEVVEANPTEASLFDLNRYKNL